ncbi:MAG: 50S ribosomal protein L1 [Candidatus Omnitrophica bacterium]|nr:50S ribosomal protein L1 [Candidatus Omnitrophota bacterium]
MASSKRQKAIIKLVEKGKEYSVENAVDMLKKGPKTKFDPSVEIDMYLDLEQSSNPVRGTVSLPFGTGKKVKIAVFCKGDLIKEAEEAGADFFGGDELIQKVAEGWCDFDVAVAVPDMMRDMAKLGKVLGPKGLMPNPKSGTVTKEIKQAIKELKAGKIEFRMDKQSGIKAPIGKLSFESNAIAENIKAFVKTIMASSPKLQRIQHIKSITVSSSMGPGIKLDKGQFAQTAEK